MKLFGSTKKDVDQDKDVKDEPNNYQQASKVLFTFVPDKQYGQLINIATHSLTMLNKSNTEFSSIEVWFTDQNSRQLEIEDNVRMILGGYYNWVVIIKMRYSTEPKYRKYVEGFNFL